MIAPLDWLTVFPLRGASALFDLAQIISLLMVWFRTRMFGRTPREIREVSSSSSSSTLSIAVAATDKSRLGV